MKKFLRAASDIHARVRTAHVDIVQKCRTNCFVHQYVPIKDRDKSIDDTGEGVCVDKRSTIRFEWIEARFRYLQSNTAGQ